MKRLLFALPFVTLLAALLLVLPASANILPIAQWDVRPGAGNDSNAGCFTPGLGGTDFSQQNAAQFSFADLASANGTNASPQVTSASHNFVAADVGNCIHISAGTNWVTGWYYCVSAAANACTMDRAVGSAAGLTSGTWVEGGALATISGAGTATAEGVNGAGGANSSQSIGLINVKSSTTTVTTTISTINSSAEWQCYNTVHGDNAGTCTVTTATNNVVLFTFGAAGNGLNQIWDGFTFTNTAGTPATGMLAANTTNYYLGLRNCVFSGFTYALDGRNVAGGIWQLVDLSGVEIKGSTIAGIANDGTINVFGSWIHNNVIGLQVNQVPQAQGSITLVNSLVTDNTGRGITTTSNYVCMTSTIANNTSDGVALGPGSTQPGAFNSTNCIYYGNGGFGANYGNIGPTGNPAPFPYTNVARINAYGSNTSGARSNLNAGLGDIALTANPFVNSAAQNYALNNVTGGGALLKSAGFPGVFPASLTTGFISVGAAQPNSAAASCTGFCKMR